jgi:UDP-glucoronosyl and UDP-glucosyl transferase
VTIGNSRDPTELGPLPPSVHVERWVPQAAGCRTRPRWWATVAPARRLTALNWGVPLVLVPLFADQGTSARRVADAGGGRRAAGRARGAVRPDQGAAWAPGQSVLPSGSRPRAGRDRRAGAHRRCRRRAGGACRSAERAALGEAPTRSPPAAPMIAPREAACGPTARHHATTAGRPRGLRCRRARLGRSKRRQHRVSRGTCLGGRRGQARTRRGVACGAAQPRADTRSSSW